MRRSRFRIVAAATMALSLVVATIAFADEIHGDELSDIRTNGSLDLGTVCAGEDATGILYLAIRRQSGGAPQIYANGTTVSIAPAGATAGLTAGAASGTVTIPGNWGSSPFGTWSPSVTADVTLNTDDVGAFLGSVTYESTGLNQNGEPRTLSDTIPVTAYVEDCSADETPPEVSISLDPVAPDGSNGWYRVTVTVTITATDDESDVESVEYSLDGDTWQDYAGPFAVSDDGEYTVHGRATSEGGTSDPVSVGFRLDATAPTVALQSLSPAAPDGANGWYVSSVTATFEVTDNLSGFDADGTLTTTDTDETGAAEGAGLTLSSPAFTDRAGNTVAAGAASTTVDVDLSDPHDVTFVGGPADAGQYVFGSVPSAPTCTAEDDVSGLASCVVTGYSEEVGEHTLTATATDNAGRTAAAELTYEVLAWTLNGFHRPVDPNGGYNTVKAGSTVPLKFNVFAGDTELTDTGVVTQIRFTAIQCDGEGDGDELLPTTTGGTSFRYDTKDGQFIYNWQTPKGAGGACYKATFTAEDGSKLTALFKLR